MMHRHISLIALCLFAAAAAGQEKADKSSASERKKESSVERKKESSVATEGAVTIAGKKIEYTATAGTLPVSMEDGKAKAKMFFVAYTKKHVHDVSKRPIMFCFNGGPGSSSVWLHMGALGPRRVLMSDEGQALPPPVKVAANEWSILDLTDLVFIDPVSTGYSRAAEAKEAREFHGVREDVRSVGEFIRLYTTRNERWKSPKYLAGESYGTTRAAALAGWLQDEHGIRLNGILLLSVVLNFQTIVVHEGNDLPYSLFLPSYAATAWFHKKRGEGMPTELTEVIAEAEKLAGGEYTLALMKGNRLSDGERQAMAKKVARLTGLSSDYVLRSNLRITPARFMSELLRDRERTIGRFDGRLVGRDLDAVGERPEYDPSYAAVQGPFTAGWNTYVRNELKYHSDTPYAILTGRVQPWNYGPAATNRYLNVAPTLRKAMTENPSLRVFVANGYMDLATPFFATKYTFDHLGGRDLARRVTLTYYEAGHMMYTRLASLKKLRSDIAKFMSPDS